MLLLLACGKNEVAKPDKFIAPETMENIIYDLSVLEAMRAVKPEYNGNSSAEYVYKKYGIDSAQFAQNSRYYAAEIDRYKKIYDKVATRIELEKNTADSLARAKGETVNRSTPAPVPQDAPQIK